MQLVKVIPAGKFRVGREENLEASVEGESIDMVGANSAANAIGCLEHRHADSGGAQCSSAGQSGEPGTDDDNVFIHAQEATDCSGLFEVTIPTRATEKRTLRWGHGCAPSLGTKWLTETEPDAGSSEDLRAMGLQLSLPHNGFRNDLFLGEVADAHRRHRLTLLRPPERCPQATQTCHERSAAGDVRGCEP